MCVTPYIATNKEGQLIPVPCGHCFECLKQWSKDWRFRLNQERKNCVASLYLTLTYNPEHLPVAFNDETNGWQSYVDKRELQNFFKRMRKNCPQLKFRYFAVGEYGGSKKGARNRAHYHVLFFFYNTANLSYRQMYNFMYYCWQGRGFIYLKSTSNRNVNYVSGYFNKIDKSPHITQPFKLMSKSIGLCYLSQKMVDYFFRTFAVGVPNPFGKGFVKLPRYYRKKLDDMTCDVVPDNYGYVWSDIVRMREYQPKGINVHFDYFCRNFTKIFTDVYREQVHICRENGISIDPRIDNPNYVFGIWRKTVKDLVDAVDVDRRLLQDALVHHSRINLDEEIKMNYSDG